MNVCFMINDNTTKVLLKTLDDSDLFMDELGETFENFQVTIIFLKRIFENKEGK